MTLAELIQMAIDTAVAGTDPNTNPIQKLRMEGETLTEQCIHWLSGEVAGNPELRARLEKRFSVTLTNGEATVPTGMIIEHLREGSVRDSDTGANNGSGNIYARVKYYNDFIQDPITVYGLYCIYDNKIIARPPASTDPTSTIGPLLIDAPFAPAKGDVSTDIPDEISDLLVQMLAVRLRGLIISQGEPQTVPTA